MGKRRPIVICENRLVELIIAALYVTTFLHAGLEKLLTPETPTWFIEQFSPTFLNVFEGSLPIQFYAIGVVELLIGLIFLVAIFFTDESRRRAGIRGGLLLATSLFVALGFGQRVTHKFDGAAFLFFYALGTFFVWRHFAVLKPAPSDE